MKFNRKTGFLYPYECRDIDYFLASFIQLSKTRINKSPTLADSSAQLVIHNSIGKILGETLQEIDAAMMCDLKS